VHLLPDRQFCVLLLNQQPEMKNVFGRTGAAAASD
jgi:hypothetical protein